MLQKYFWLIMIASLVVGFVFTDFGLFVKNYITYILILMMTISCLKIDLKKVSAAAKDWKWFLVILTTCYLLSLFVIWLGRGWVEPNIFVGLVVAASVPCAISVVFMSDLMGGDPNRALLATTIAHFMAPIVTPFLIWSVAREIVDVDFMTMFVLVIKLIIIPIVLSQIFGRSHRSDFFKRNALSINTVLLFLLNWGMVSSVKNVITGNISVLVPATLISACAISFQIFVAIRFGDNFKSKTTGAVVTMYKNTGLAAVITTTVFGPAVAAGTVVYVLVSNVLLMPLQYWATSRKRQT